MPYFGSKQTIADRIVAEFPEHQHYVEPYAGSLAVLLAKPASPMETVNDLDEALMTFWRVLRDRPDDLIAVCEMTPHSRTEYQASCHLPPDLDEVELARRVWVQLTQGRVGTRRRTGWRLYQDPAGCSTSMPGYLAGYRRRMPPAAERLMAVSLECRPALEVIAAYGRHPEVLLYVDPPYLGTTRATRQYAVEMSSAAGHQELIEALLGCRAAVVLSGYPSLLYDDALSGWRRVEIEAFTGQANTAGRRTEVLWINRETRPTLFEVTA